jgi:FKBP-type peptidyl-prolyl cis-trans isomerase FkpA
MRLTTLLIRLIPLVALLAVAGCSSSNPAAPTTSSGPYSQTDLVVGTGATANAGNRVTVGYTGWLYDTSKTDGKGTSFDSSPGFAFVLGTGAVIKGWDQGVAGMQVGGRRRLIIPPDLAYGNNSPDPTKIPQNATLVFDIALTAVQ